jgi:hypothetical protein
VRGQLTLYPAARNLLWVGLGGLALAAGSVFFSLAWPVAWIATGFLAGSALVAILLGSVPPVEINESQLVQLNRRISWSSIYEVRRVLWTPLIVRLKLASRHEVLVVYPGNESSRAALLHDIRRMSRSAVIEGLPYREFWGAAPVAPGAAVETRGARYPLLLPEDEAEVERLFQQLKIAGRIEPKNSSEEK